MDAADRRSFEASVRQAAELRSLDDALGDLGWYDAIAADPAAAAPLFAVQGELNLVSSAIDDVVAAALGLAPSATTAVALPALGAASPLSEQIRGIGTARLAHADEVVVVVQHGGNAVACRVASSTLSLRPIGGIDPAAGWVDVSGEVGDIRAATPVSWDDATAAARRAIATELTSASRAMLGLARDHAVERIQFGRPISSFQAVRHRLADALVAVESAQAAVDVAWVEPSSFASAMAKAIAGRSARTVAKQAQQVLAGMGFTSEHAFHRYLKRTMFLDQLFGSSGQISEDIGNEVLRERRVPAILPL